MVGGDSTPGAGRGLFSGVRLLRYAVTGGLSALTHVGTLTVLVETGRAEPVAASTIGFVLSIVVSYSMQKAWVFSSTASHRTTLPRFLVATTVALLLNAGVVAVGTQILTMHYVLVQAVALVLIPLSNYLINSLWTFRDSPAPATGWAWLGLWSRVVLLPVLVLLPLLRLPLVADHRFNVFQYGGRLTQRPWELVTAPINSVPNYLDHGNFRPLGRMVEQGQDLIAFSLSRTADLPVSTALRVVAVVFVALLCVSAVLWAETVSRDGQVLSGPPSVVAHLAALAVPVLLVGSPTSAAALFTALYACSAMIVLLVATVAARRPWFDGRRAGPLLLGGSLLVGGAMAAFNEITYLAVPLAVVTVAARGLLTLRMRPVDLLRCTAVRVTLGAAFGFLAVLVPVRLVIAERCAAGGCYAASDLSISEAALPAFGHRLLSAVPPVAWTAAPPEQWLPGRDPVLLVSLAVVVLLTVLTFRRVRAAGLPSVDGVLAVALAGMALLLGSSVAMALTSEVQQRVLAGHWPVGRGWRDLGLVAAGSGLVLSAAGTSLVRLGRRRLRMARASTAVVVAGLGLAVMITLSVNATLAATARAGSEGELFDRISHALLHPDPAADEERCAMLEEFAALHPQRTDWHRRLDTSLATASQALHHAPFCVEGDR